MMKKTILATLAVASLVSCSNEEIVSINNEAITFDNTFVENATRAIDGSYATGTLNAFQVYGTITNDTNKGTANIFEGETVSKNGTGWIYDSNNTQYWIPGNTYYFCAVADGNVENVTSVSLGEYDMPTAINLLDASAQKDILYTESQRMSYKSGDGAKSVSFIFSHLLAKAKFTFKNTITTNNGYSYQVSDVTIKDTEKNAVYDIATSSWNKAQTTEYYDLSFGKLVAADANAVAEKPADIGHNSNAVSNYERLLVPAEKSLTVSFSYELLKDGQVIDTQNKTIATPSILLEAGKAYNFVISLGNPGEPITFDVTKINEWATKDGETNLN